MIQVIHRAFDIFELCAKNPEKALSLGEIADTLQLNHGTCANIIKTLVNRSYLEQEGYKKGYRLGPMAYRLTGNMSQKRELIKASKEAMETLVQELNETCLLGVIRKQDFKRVVWHRVVCDQELTVSTLSEKDAYNTTTGRVLLAYMPEAELDALISKFGLPDVSIWPAANTREKLAAELAGIKKEGYAIQTTQNQIVGLAVPVFKDAVAVAGLSVYMPAMRYTGEMKGLLLSRLKQAGIEIGHKLCNDISKF